MDFIDVKYINLLSLKLQKFKKVKNNLFNCRCPICGDSKKNLNKARGYFYQIKNNTNFKCHNCGVNLSFNNLLKQVDRTLFDEYIFEKFKDGKTGRNFVTNEPKFEFKKPVFKKSPKIDLPKASSNPEAKEYLESRKLNSNKFYYTDKFKSWINSVKQTFDDIKYDEPRIIIPLFYKEELVGVQGRSLNFLNPKSVKYITVMFKDDAPKIFGFDKIRTDAQIYVTEGPFDSTFIPNSIAMCGADADIGKWGIRNAVWIYDNEPRNREILSRIERTIDAGEKVVIWPSNIVEKDINDMIINGHDPISVVKSNTYSGLKARIKFNEWKRV
jgi:hypothetical protein